MEFWTYEHICTVIPTFIIMLFIALMLRKLLINEPLEFRMLPIKIIAIIILILEIVKQAYSLKIGYDLYHIPLHFCSMFVYVLPLLAFYRGKLQSEIHSFACAAMTALFVGMLVMPNIIYENTRLYTFFTDFFSFHTVFFHNIVIFAFLLTITLNLHVPTGNKKEVGIIALLGAIFAATSATASHLLDTNFSTFLYTSIDFIEQTVEKLRMTIGDLETTILYTVALSILIIIFIIICNYLFRLLCYKKRQNR